MAVDTMATTAAYLLISKCPLATRVAPAADEDARRRLCTLRGSAACPATLEACFVSCVTVVWFAYVMLLLVLPPWEVGGTQWRHPPPNRPAPGWRNTVEIALLEISNSMKPYLCVSRTRLSYEAGDSFVLSQTISTRLPTVFRQPLTLTACPGCLVEPWCM